MVCTQTRWNSTIRWEALSAPLGSAHNSMWKVRESWALLYLSPIQNSEYFFRPLEMFVKFACPDSWAKKSMQKIKEFPWEFHHHNSTKIYVTTLEIEIEFLKFRSKFSSFSFILRKSKILTNAPALHIFTSILRRGTSRRYECSHRHWLLRTEIWGRHQYTGWPTNSNGPSPLTRKRKNS